MYDLVRVRVRARVSIRVSISVSVSVRARVSRVKRARGRVIRVKGPRGRASTAACIIFCEFALAPLSMCATCSSTAVVKLEALG